MTKDEELEQLRQENSALRDQVAQLSERISVLEAQLAKDSHNSHLPPSSDRFHRQSKSLRKKSGKQPGGQSGHAGNTLKLSSTPDLVIVHPVECCQHCQRDLREVESLAVERLQDTFYRHGEQFIGMRQAKLLQKVTRHLRRALTRKSARGRATLQNCFVEQSSCGRHREQRSNREAAR